jgi:hypothetical protein
MDALMDEGSRGQPAVRVILAAARVSDQPLAALTLAAATRVSVEENNKIT